jgi:hypothetical protein
LKKSGMFNVARTRKRMVYGGPQHGSLNVFSMKHLAAKLVAATRMPA